MKLKVTEVEHYTDNLFRIRTERPQTFRFSAGEFVMINLDDTPKRAYSLTSGPYDNYLEFYSIKVPNGPLTSKLQNIKIGDELEVGERSTGTLTLANLELGGNLWLLATGTGIAPFISLLRDYETHESFDNIYLYWSVRTAAELRAYDPFLLFQDIIYHPIVTQDKSFWGKQNRITRLIRMGEIVPDLDPTKDKVMICGSLDFNNEVKHMLDGWGWKEGTKKTAGSFVQERAFVGN